MRLGRILVPRDASCYCDCCSTSVAKQLLIQLASSMMRSPKMQMSTCISLSMFYNEIVQHAKSFMMMAPPTVIVVRIRVARKIIVVAVGAKAILCEGKIIDFNPCNHTQEASKRLHWLRERVTMPFLCAYCCD